MTALLWETAEISKSGKGKGRKKVISKRCSPRSGRVMVNQIMSPLCSGCMAPISLRVKAKVFMVA